MMPRWFRRTLRGRGDVDRDVVFRGSRSSDRDSVRPAVGGGLFVTRSTISGDDGDGGMPDQPRGHRRGVAIGQNVDDPSPLQVTNDRPVAMTPLPGPVINTDYPRFRGRLGNTPADDAKQGIFTYRQQ
jgi:hypothetical protein